MAAIKLDRAYCHETDSVLTIYQVRDLHFDEEQDFNARSSNFECPDEDCGAALVGVNHAKAEFKYAPHFRLLTNDRHDDLCDYIEGRKKGLTNTKKEIGLERNYKVSEHPEILLLERQKTPLGTGKPRKSKKTDTSATHTLETSIPNDENENTSPHETSCLEHVVETWVSNSPEDLQNSLLTLGDKTKWYRNAFKPIKYFYKEEGLIYWGEVKSIKKYTRKSSSGSDYAITFSDRPWFEGESRQVSIYISSELIDGYRKRKLFRRYIESLIDHGNRGVTCYFVGAYPELKDNDVITQKGSFRPLEVRLENLDHLTLRFDEDGEDL